MGSRGRAARATVSEKPKKQSIVCDEATGKPCRKYLGKQQRDAKAEDIDDAIQEAYTILFSKDREISNPTAYFQKMIKNILLDQLQQRRREASVLLFAGAAECHEQESGE